MITYIEEGELPADVKMAQAAERRNFEVKDGVLYFAERDGTLKLVPPTARREELFEQLHQGPFGAHLSAKKVIGQTARHY